MTALGLVALLIALTLVALAARVSIGVEFAYADELRGHARLRALFGLVDTELSTSSGAKRSPRRHERRSKERRKRTSRRVAPRRVLAALDSDGVLAASRLYAQRLRQALRFSELFASFRIGLDDPADTGLAWGFCGPLAIILSDRHPGLSLTPVFERPCFEADVKGSLSVMPLALIAATLAFMLTPAVLHAAYLIWRAR